jgi:hypothetical protein
MRMLCLSVVWPLTLAACTGTTTDVHPVVRGAAPTTTTSPTDKYNPTHDPSVCVKPNPDGTVRITHVRPAPGYDPAKMDPAIYGKCG